MMFKTHLALGFLIGLLSLNFINVNNPVIFLILVTLFSSLPDIDHPKSRIGRKLFFISWPISLIFNHRGFFHSIFPPIILFALLSIINLNFLAITVAIGYLSHLIGDAVTLEGIKFLHPITAFTIRGPIRTGNFFEFLIYISIIFFDIMLTAKLFNIL